MSTIKKSASLCIVFICQAGELELKALLLAVTIKQHNEKLLSSGSLQLIAAIPDEQLWGEVSKDTKVLFEELGIEIKYIDSPFGKEYPIGNKLAALAVENQCDTTMYLDTDILCLTSLNLNDLCTDGFLSKPADFNTFTSEVKQWELAYQSFNLSLPEERVIATVSQEAMLPYFNAGAICVAQNQMFAKCWLETAKMIDANTDITNKRPWLDQIALPITVKRCGFELAVLSEKYNYPAHVKTLPKKSLPIFCHYHWPKIINQESKLKNEVLSIINEYPVIRQLIENFPEWNCISQVGSKSVAKKKFFFKRKPEDEVNYLISGMPRSGTSLLCNVLHKLVNSVVLNEPKEIFSILTQDREGEQFQSLYREWRTNIQLGEPVENKLDQNNQVIEDTRLNDERRLYHPEVSSLHFHLGSKNTLAYLNRLRLLCEHQKEIKKIIMIRHPFDAISSWKNSFAHLREVNLRAFPFSEQQDGLIDGYQRKALAEIHSCENFAFRRALLWRYLSELIWRDRQNCLVIRYEDLTKEPEKELKKVVKYLNFKSFEKSIVNNISYHVNRKHLTQEDMLAIKLICGEVVERWGYELSS